MPTQIRQSASGISPIWYNKDCFSHQNRVNCLGPVYFRFNSQILTSSLPFSLEGLSAYLHTVPADLYYAYIMISVKHLYLRYFRLKHFRTEIRRYFAYKRN